jgi:hypothetical protein
MERFSHQAGCKINGDVVSGDRFKRRELGAPARSSRGEKSVYADTEESIAFFCLIGLTVVAAGVLRLAGFFVFLPTFVACSHGDNWSVHA